MDTKKGMRQPHLSNPSVPKAERVIKITVNEINNTNVAVVWIQEVQYPLLLGWAYSAT